MGPTLTQTPRLELRLTGLQILTLRLLAQPLATLEHEIEDALDENPFLERLDAPAPPAAQTPDPPDISFAPRMERTPVSTEEREPLSMENFPGAAPSLAEHLLEQLRHVARDADVLLNGETIIWSLDENGYLRTPLADIAALAESSLPAVERALALVQGFDPSGVAARDLRECLLLQLRADPAADPITMEIVANHCEALGNRRYEHLARLLGVPLPGVLAAAEKIRRLDPKPGRPFGAADVRLVEPEVTVTKVHGEFVITLNDRGLPVLGVARGYRGLPERLSAEERRYVSERRQAARWFVEAVERRRQTLRRVVEAVVRFQRDFFERGPEGLRPLVLRQVAEENSMHESTVSRATSAKYADTPHGVFPLRHFFASGVPTAAGGLVATAAVKACLRTLVEAEDGRHPLSDQALASALRHRGFPLARRTVAKYRGELAIPPCHQRMGRHQDTRPPARR